MDRPVNDQGVLGKDLCPPWRTPKITLLEDALHNMPPFRGVIPGAPRRLIMVLAHKRKERVKVVSQSTVLGRSHATRTAVGYP